MIPQVMLFVGVWGMVSVGVYVVKYGTAEKNKIDVWSCRSTLKKYKKIDDCDNKSLF